MEKNPDTGQEYLTQWFERNRFELHPENAPPYDVLLGRLGDDRLRQLGEDWHSRPREQGPQPGCLWFEETGHNVCSSFKTYWESHGLKAPALDPFRQSLALFGLPITEDRLEVNQSGDQVLTQWFERARLEWHPDKPQEFRVLLGLLGNEVSSAPPASGVTKVVVLDNHTGFRFGSSFEVVGQVQNQTAGPVHWPTIRASFYDSAGHLLGVGDGQVLLAELKPGQKSSFLVVLFDAPKDISRYELQVQWERGWFKSEPLFDQFQVSQLSTRDAAINDAKYIIGQVRNDTGGPIKSAIVVATLYDAQDRVLNVEFTYLNDLQAGSMTPFQILAWPWRGATRYELQLQGRRS